MLWYQNKKTTYVHQGKANFYFTSVTDAIRRRLPNNSYNEAKRDLTKKSIVSVIVDRIVK